MNKEILKLLIILGVLATLMSLSSMMFDVIS